MTNQTTITPELEQRLAALWATIDDFFDEEDFRSRIDALVADLPVDHPVALFERACAFDSTGHSDQAVPLYQQALAGGLDGLRRRRTVIQMSSSLRNIGRAPESVVLLTAERAAGSDELDDAIVATLALALIDVGREREAAAIAIEALAPHLVRYQRSMGNYARALML